MQGLRIFYVPKREKKLSCGRWNVISFAPMWFEETAFDRPAQERFDPGVDLLAQPADLALGDAAHAHGPDRIVDRAGRDAMHVSFLHHRGERLLRQPARLQEGRKVAALAQLGDAQFDCARARLPCPVAIAVALVDPISAALAMGGAV